MQPNPIDSARRQWLTERQLIACSCFTLGRVSEHSRTEARLLNRTLQQAARERADRLNAQQLQLQSADQVDENGWSQACDGRWRAWHPDQSQALGDTASYGSVAQRPSRHGHQYGSSIHSARKAAYQVETPQDKEPIERKAPV